MKLDELSTNLKKQHGDTFVTSAKEIGDVVRLPTGIFPFDFSTGGGFPRGKFSILWGAESSGKTNLLLKAIVMNQFLEPDKKNVFIDVEHSFDPKWAQMMGVDLDRLFVTKPDYGEQAVDIIQAAIGAEDVGVVGIDSIAALTPVNEDLSTAEKAQVGGNAILVKKMIQKSIIKLSQQSRVGRFPTVIAINQMRSKIGVMFGNPEKMPGGKSLDHASGLTVRIGASDIYDKSVLDKKPVAKEMRCKIKKTKIQMIHDEFQFVFPVVNAGSYRIGQIPSWKFVSNYLKTLGWLYKEGKWVHCLDKQFKTFVETGEYFKDNPEVYSALKQRIIDQYMEDMYGVEEEDTD